MTSMYLDISRSCLNDLLFEAVFARAFNKHTRGEIIDEETQRAEIDQNALQRQGRVEYGILNEVNYSSGLEYDAPSPV